jgi:uncharacterized repeat protein (TIGR01451 family)
LTLRRLGSLAAALAAACIGVVSLLAVSSARTAPNNVADLAVAKLHRPGPALLGSDVVYTLRVTNAGPDTANGVEVIDRLPRHAVLLGASATSGTCRQTALRLTCRLGDMDADPTRANPVLVTIEVRPTRPGRLKNRATVDSAATDPLADNNRTRARTVVLPHLPRRARRQPRALPRRARDGARRVPRRHRPHQRSTRPALA